MFSPNLGSYVLEPYYTHPGGTQTMVKHTKTSECCDSLVLTQLWFACPPCLGWFFLLIDYVAGRNPAPTEVVIPWFTGFYTSQLASRICFRHPYQQIQVNIFQRKPPYWQTVWWVTKCHPHEGSLLFWEWEIPKWRVHLEYGRMDDTAMSFVVFFDFVCTVTSQVTRNFYFFYHRNSLPS